MTESLNIIQRLIRWMRPESSEFQDATAENITREREDVDAEYERLLHSARRARRAADAMIVAAELFVKDIKGTSSDGKKASSRPKKAK